VLRAADRIVRQATSPAQSSTQSGADSGARAVAHTGALSSALGARSGALSTVQNGDAVIRPGGGGDGGDAFMEAFAGAFFLVLEGGPPGVPGLPQLQAPEPVPGPQEGVRLSLALGMRPGVIRLNVAAPDEAGSDSLFSGPRVSTKTHGQPASRVLLIEDIIARGRATADSVVTGPLLAQRLTFASRYGNPNFGYDGPAGPDVTVWTDDYLVFGPSRPQLDIRVGDPPAMPSGCGATPAAGGSGYGGGSLKLRLGATVSATLGGFNAGAGGFGIPGGAAGAPGQLQITVDTNGDGQDDLIDLNVLTPVWPPSPAAFPIQLDINGDGIPDVFLPSPSFQPGVPGQPCPTFSGEPVKFDFRAFPLGQIGPDTRATLPVVRVADGAQEGTFDAFTSTGNLFHGLNPNYRLYLDAPARLELRSAVPLPPVTRMRITTANHRFLSGSCPVVITLRDGSNATREFRFTSAPTDGALELALELLALEQAVISLGGSCSSGAFFGMKEVWLFFD
jgi:hypothetical protein